MKECNRCNNQKEEYQFYSYGGYECKDCARLRTNNYTKTKTGYLTNVYSGQKGRSKRMGYKLPSYTKEELWVWLISQECWETLWNSWVSSGYEHNLRPSIDRLDDYKPYDLKNIRLVTWKVNNDKGRSDIINGINTKSSCGVLQFDKLGNYLNEYQSINKASRETGVGCGSICNVLKGRQNKAGGFIWKIKD